MASAELALARQKAYDYAPVKERIKELSNAICTRHLPGCFLIVAMIQQALCNLTLTGSPATRHEPRDPHPHSGTCRLPLDQGKAWGAVGGATD